MVPTLSVVEDRVDVHVAPGCQSTELGVTGTQGAKQHGEQLGSVLPKEMILYPLLGTVLLIEHGC